MRVKSFPEKLAKWECVDTQDPWLGRILNSFTLFETEYLELEIFKTEIYVTKSFFKT